IWAASRIPGVTPAAIVNLLRFVKSNYQDTVKSGQEAASGETRLKMDHNFQLDEYYQALYGQKLLKMLQKVPQEDSMSTSTQLLVKQRHGLDINQALESQRQEFHVKMERVRLWKEEFNQKSEHMKEQLLKFNTFIQDNDRKKARALMKAETESLLRHQKERDLKDLKTEVQHLNRVRDDLRRRLDIYCVYKRFAEQVVQTSSLFQELHDVTSRYQTLVSTRDALMRVIHESHEDLKRKKKQLSKFVDDKNDELLYFNNHLAELQSRLDSAQSQRLKWDAQWAHIQNTAAKKTLLLGTIKMATLNLYYVVVNYMHEQPTLAMDDTIKQFEK
ncbi:coiled-coil domain-containing protein 42-like, partial [Heterodontus francisci]|uniref:coiled-coil domain-containing protein 42-like n=1 Tax=Heterodontus francisci TaxID=7792 RepID=UPI00355B5825